jgi:hypothetical protein
MNNAIKPATKYPSRTRYRMFDYQINKVRARPSGQKSEVARIDLGVKYARPGDGR